MKSVLLALLAPTLLLAAPKPLFQSKLITSATPNHSVDIDVSLEGAKELFLVVTDGGNGFTADWADWAEPRLILADGSEKKLTDIEWKSAQTGWNSVRVNASAGGTELRSAGKAIEFGISPVPAAAAGVITACLGGIIRDITAGVPSILMRHELYVTAAVASAAVFVTTTFLGLSVPWPALAGFIAGFALRGAAIRWGLTLPPHKGH